MILDLRAHSGTTPTTGEAGRVAAPDGDEVGADVAIACSNRSIIEGEGWQPSSQRRYQVTWIRPSDNWEGEQVTAHK
jgi:hypothetical protein